MSSFDSIHHRRVVGKLTMFDRMVFKGHLSQLMPDGAFQRFLSSQGVLLKDFKDFVGQATAEVKAHAQQLAAEADRPYLYLQGAATKRSGQSKEELARFIAERDGVEHGLVCVLATVELATSFEVGGNHQTHRLQAVRNGQGLDPPAPRGRRRAPGCGLTSLGAGRRGRRSRSAGRRLVTGVVAQPRRLAHPPDSALAGKPVGDPVDLLMRLDPGRLADLAIGQPGALPQQRHHPFCVAHHRLPSALVSGPDGIRCADGLQRRRRRVLSAAATPRAAVGGPRRLGDCTGRHPWPRRGVYFIFEDGELRHHGTTPRVVRVGTHALKPGSQTSLWQRLAQHRGTRPHSQPGGNHRGSVFRHHVGLALLNRGLHPEAAASWALPHPTSEARAREARLEATVSTTIGAMRVLWVAVDDEPGPDSQRGRIEANSIALLSASCTAVDPPSRGWLGHAARSERIRTSGLWNVNHVHEPYDRSFLASLAASVERTPKPVN